MNPSIISCLMNRLSRSTDHSNCKTMKDQDDHSSSLLKEPNYDNIFKSSEWMLELEHDCCAKPQHGAALIHTFDDDGASLASSPPRREQFRMKPIQLQDALRNYIGTHLPHPSHPTDPNADDHDKSTGSGLSVATLDGVPDAAKFFRASESSRQVYDASSSAVAGTAGATSIVLPEEEANESPESFRFGLLDSREDPELQPQSPTQGFHIPDVNRDTVGSPPLPTFESTIEGDNWINQFVARRRIWIAVESRLQSPPTPESFYCVPDHQLPIQLQDALRNYIGTHLPHPSHPTDPNADDHDKSTGSGLSVATLDGVPDAAKFFRASESSRQVYDASSSAVAGTAGATRMINVPSQTELSQRTPVLGLRGVDVSNDPFVHLTAQAQSEILGHTSATAAMISEKPPALTTVAIDLAEQKTTGLEVPNDEIERQRKRRSSLIAAAGDVFTTSKSSRRRRTSIANDDDSATSDVAVASADLDDVVDDLLSSDPLTTPNVKKIIHSREINDNDVFFGQGTRSNKNVGNKNYLNFISERKEEYSAAGENKKEKRRIAQTVEQHVHSSGGRFIERVADGHKKYREYKETLKVGYLVNKDGIQEPLSPKVRKLREMYVIYWENLTSSVEFNKEDANLWYVVSDEMRREKVTQCLRNKPKISKTP